MNSFLLFKAIVLIVLIVLLSEVESYDPDFSQYECRDAEKAKIVFTFLNDCMFTKYEIQNKGSPKGCSMTEFSCNDYQLIKRECKPNKAAVDWFKSGLEVTIANCNREKELNETYDNYYRRVCPKYVGKPVPSIIGSDTCKEYMPCTLSPDSMTFTQSGSNSLQSMAQILAILSIIAILYANIY